MKTNMGTLDRVLRTVVALVIAALYYTGKISGTVAIVLGAFAVIFLLTSFVSFCPLYTPLGISTVKAPKA